MKTISLASLLAALSTTFLATFLANGAFAIEGPVQFPHFPTDGTHYECDGPDNQNLQLVVENDGSISLNSAYASGTLERMARVGQFEVFHGAMIGKLAKIVTQTQVRLEYPLLSGAAQGTLIMDGAVYSCGILMY